MFNSLLLKRSTIPFPAGWYGVVLYLAIPVNLQSFDMIWLTKVAPWSEWSFRGNPYGTTKPLNKDSAVVLAFWFFVGIAIPNLVKFSVITRIFRKVLKTSNPYRPFRGVVWCGYQPKGFLHYSGFSVEYSVHTTDWIHCCILAIMLCQYTRSMSLCAHLMTFSTSSSVTLLYN